MLKKSGKTAERAALGWVVAAGMEGVTAADSPEAAEGAADRSVLLDGQDEIGTAARLEAATLPKDGAEGPLIEPDCGNQETAGDVPNGIGEPVHGNCLGGGAGWSLACDSLRRS